MRRRNGLLQIDIVRVGFIKFREKKSLYIAAIDGNGISCQISKELRLDVAAIPQSAQNGQFLEIQRQFCLLWKPLSEKWTASEATVFCAKNPYSSHRRIQRGLCILLLSLTPIFAYREISGILDNTVDLTPEEINALRPLFYYLQEQYNFIVDQAPLEELDEDDTQVQDPQYKAAQAELEQYFDALQQQYTFGEDNNTVNLYNTTLPTVTELLGFAGIDLTAVELAERDDIESLLQETLDEAQQQIDEIVRDSLQLESQLIKINKPKIVAYIFRALRVLFKVATRGARAAYCTYSHIPQLNVSLQHIYEGVDCYSYSKRLVLRIEQETVHTVSTIQKNVHSLAGIYKRIAGKKSLLGKLSVVLLNLSKIVANIKETYLLGVSALDKARNELPNATQGSVNCSRDFVSGVPQMVETVANLSTCIMYVDNTTVEYDFMKPENERDFN
ncbi:uncharacterized protein LOC126760606 [Bactrocera neohumeralis]|uniref:uncharacterized protein LOC126760606 n=1 Tax=Bactrocera neohumeralis TaxID=98809 RepID=UPI002166196E|nr:uncharacterized protein LOC126760606 [Bactrocera neohumeralis]